MDTSPPASASGIAGSAVDWQIAREAMGGDEALLLSVIEVLLDEAPRHLEAIRGAARSADAAALRRAAHTLKGSLRYFGAEAAATRAEQVELLGQSGTSDVSPESLATLEAEVRTVLGELDQFRRRNSPGSA